jgi:hypothetical protein
VVVPILLSVSPVLFSRTIAHLKFSRKPLDLRDTAVKIFRNVKDQMGSRGVDRMPTIASSMNIFLETMITASTETDPTSCDSKA